MSTASGLDGQAMGTFVENLDTDLKHGGAAATVDTTIKNTLKKYFAWDVDEDMEAMCEKFTVSEDGTLTRSKTVRPVESMKIEGYSKEFRENYIADLEAARSDKIFASDDINDHLIDLHLFVMESLKFYPLDFKVEFVQEVAEMFENVRDSSFFTKKIAKIKDTFAEDAREDSREIEKDDNLPFLRHCEEFEFLMSRLSSKTLLHESFESNYDSVYNPDAEDYSKMSEDLFTLWEETKDESVENRRILKQRTYEELQSTPDQFERSFMDGIQLVFKKMHETKGAYWDFFWEMCDNGRDVRVLDTLRLDALDVEVIKNEVQHRGRGILHPILLRKYLVDLQNYREAFRKMKIMSFTIETDTDHVYENALRGLISHGIRLFSPDEYLHFLGSAKLVRINIDDKFIDIICDKAWKDKQKEKYGNALVQNAMKARAEAQNCVYRIPDPDDVVPNKKWLEYCENERIEQSLHYYEFEEESKSRDKVRNRLRKSVMSKSTFSEEEEDDPDQFEIAAMSKHKAGAYQDSPMGKQTSSGFADSRKNKQTPLRRASSEEVPAADKMPIIESFIDYNLWPKFDRNRDGNLDVIETKQMLAHYTKKEISANKCAQFLSSISEEGNESIKKADFATFLGIGMTLSAAELEEYSARSALHQILALLIVELNEQMKKPFEGKTVSRRKNQRGDEPGDEPLSTPQKPEEPKSTKSGKTIHHKTEDMNRFLSLMWSHYDPENLGTMDYQHLQELMTHYTGHVLDEDLQAEFNVFVTMLDQDKSGYLDRTEVSNFITFGANMTNTEQKMYSSQSRFHAIVTTFFIGLQKAMVDFNKLFARVLKIAAFKGSISYAAMKTLMYQFTSDVEIAGELEISFNMFLAKFNKGTPNSLTKDGLEAMVAFGIAMNRKERRAYAKRGQIEKILVTFYNRLEGHHEKRKSIAQESGEAIIAKRAENLEKFLTEVVWNELDAGVELADLDSSHAKKLFEKYTKHHMISESDCQKLLNHLDKDQSGKVNHEELAKFVSVGFALSAEQRERYARQGNFHVMIVEFFEAMDTELKEYEKSHNIHVR
jgi:Ca2+-binding EF-hand superfamily protein